MSAGPLSTSVMLSSHQLQSVIVMFSAHLMSTHFHEEGNHRKNKLIIFFPQKSVYWFAVFIRLRGALISHVVVDIRHQHQEMWKKYEELWRKLRRTEEMKVCKTVGGTCHSEPDTHQFQIKTSLFSRLDIFSRKNTMKMNENEINSHPVVRQREVSVVFFKDNYLVMTVIAGFM